MNTYRNRYRLFASSIIFALLFVSLAPAIQAQDGDTIFLPVVITPGQASDAPIDDPGETPPGENERPAPLALIRYADDGQWPAQLAGSTGDVRPGIHGPQRNLPEEGIPQHAYSPFDERNNREHPCPPDGCDAVANQVLIKFASDVSVAQTRSGAEWTQSSELNQSLSAAGIVQLTPVFPGAKPPTPGQTVMSASGQVAPAPDLTRWYKATLENEAGEAADLTVTLDALAQSDQIEWVEPDFVRRLAGEGPQDSASTANSTVTNPQRNAHIAVNYNDPLYAQQWHLNAVNAPAAWTYLTGEGLPAGGSRDIVVAVIDTGVDYTHPDLAANIWVNSQEIPNNGVDDDGNGFVDDIYGVNVVSNQHSGDPMDDHGHGTHVAGIIAAQGDNGIGGVGVAPNVQIMAIKAAQYSGVLSTSDIAEAIYYAVQQGADVINMSFGGYARSQVEEDALAVAFGQAVLVAAAGNDGVVNLPCPFGRDMYPAAYNWVLGVMASTSAGNRASFSNFDCTPHDTHEYELLAPGVDVWSTLPMEQYAAWDGTSMSTPVVSGIAALARTKWNDKDVYSSRFIMGQIASNANPVADALATLTEAPQPELSYLEHWTFDTASQDPIDDNDGIVDAGETIDLAIVIRNHWGKADPVTVTLEAWAEGATQPDPYVTMITDTVSYGAVGSFNVDDNGLIYDDQGVITGVRHPFRFTVDPDTPNDHVIPFRLTMTARNGLDPTDTTVYTFTSRFYLIVQRGRELPRIISEDMVLTKDYYWLVPDQTLIEANAAVTITEGTQVQWGSPDPNDPYGEGTTPYIQVPGSLIAQGTFTEPIELFPSPLVGWHVFIKNSGTTQLQYTKVRNPQLGLYGMYFRLNSIDHSYIDWDNNCWGIGSSVFTKSIVHKVRGGPCGNGAFGLSSIEDSLFDSSWIGDSNWFDITSIHNSVFLQDNQNDHPIHWQVQQYPYSSESDAVLDDHFRKNAFLSKYWDPNVNHWMRISPYYQWGRDKYVGLTNNYWGTTSTTLIDAAIIDFNDDFNKAHIVYQPILTTPVTTTYPFVVDVLLSTAGQSGMSALTGPTPIIGAEPVTFTVTFNRDMDTSVQPSVSFGPDVPNTDYTIHPIDGGWQDARTWVGTFNVNPITGDGYQLMRIAGPARAADDPWLVIGDDVERFRFEIQTSGTEAMNLQATGGEGYVDLSWTQDDFDLLAGYNLYRSTTPDGTFSLVNQGLIPAQQKNYRDVNVQPGQPYYYKFTVVKTDMSESDFSNTAAATPVDTIAPVIVHTPTTTAQPGLALSLFADVTDNVGVQEVILYYRQIGADAYSSQAMVHTSGNRYTATIPGSAITAPGIEYYLTASDGVSTVSHGRPELPHQVSVDDKPVVTTIAPASGPAAGGTSVTISGSNFKAGATVMLGGTPADNVAVLSSNQITCIAPAHFPGVVDVTVTNPDNQSHTLLQGFTYIGDTVSLSLPDTGSGQDGITQIPVNAANVNGLVAAELTVTFDSNVVTARGASTGNLTPGWSLTFNNAIPGQISIAMVSPGAPADGAGTLAYLEFEAVGAPGANTTLEPTSILFNDGDLSVDAQSGSFSIDQVYDVSGAIQFWNGGVVSDTLLTLDGDRLYIGLSDVSGDYTVAGAANDDYVLTPSKSDDAKGVSAFDASLVLRHTVGLAQLSGYAATAGDVNKNGSINSMDAYYILQKAVGLITLPFPGAGEVWSFSPDSYAIADLNSNLTGRDFTAILLGDPSGNWSTAVNQIAVASASVPQVSVSSAPVGDDGTATANVRITPDGTPAYSLEVTLTYPESSASVSAVETTESTADWMLAANWSEPGKVRVALAGATPITAAEEAFTLHFTANEGVESIPVWITAATINETDVAIETPRRLFLPWVSGGTP